jgi:hypothetical protein
MFCGTGWRNFYGAPELYELAPADLPPLVLRTE